ncbi:MAG: hypothetical protein Q9190_000471 [Brigantiaea leucoxantha]
MPHPQAIDLVSVSKAPKPVIINPAIDTAVNSDLYSPDDGSDTKKRSLEKRDGDCSKQPDGAGPVASPDTSAAFLASSDLQSQANNAPVPDGYATAFSNLQGSLSASSYMGYAGLNSYDVLSCAQACDQAEGCQAFNIFAERDPSLNPNAQNCPNPPSVTNYKCTLWGVPVSSAEATNKGQWRDSFEVVITASNAYNKATPPPAISGFTGPQELGGAINAPLDSQGHDTYLGFKYFPFSQDQGYTPSTCADACVAETNWRKSHPDADGTYKTCVRFLTHSTPADRQLSGRGQGTVFADKLYAGLLQCLCAVHERGSAGLVLLAVQPGVGTLVREQLRADEGERSIYDFTLL